MSKTKPTQPARAGDRKAGPEGAQGSLFPEAAQTPPAPPPTASAVAPDATRATAPSPAPKPKARRAPRAKGSPQPVVRGRRRKPPAGLAALHAKLLAAGDYPEATVILRPSMVGTHPAHPDQIVGPGPEAIMTLRYAIISNGDGAHLGNILVHGENRFTLVAPLIQERVTIHVNLAAAAMRADIAAESYLARAAAGTARQGAA